MDEQGNRVQFRSPAEAGLRMKCDGVLVPPTEVGGKGWPAKGRPAGAADLPFVSCNYNAS